MEVILVGILSALSALAGTLITQLYESRRRLSEENRWYAEFFLSRKVDALQNLYAALVECHHTLNFYGNVPPKTLIEHREQVMSRVEAYLKAMSLASLYLDDEAENILSKALGAFRQASMAIFLSLPDDQCPANKDSYPEIIKNLDWKAFLKAYESAAQYLKKILNPHILRKIDMKMIDSPKTRQL
jgi:hypothetical protein